MCADCRLSGCSAAPTANPVFETVGFPAGRIDPKPEAGDFRIPDRVFALAGRRRIDSPLCDLDRCPRRAGRSARCGSSPRRSAASEAFFTAGYGIRGYLEGLVGAMMKTFSKYVNHAANTPPDVAFQTAKRAA